VIKKITKLCLAGTLALGTVGTAYAADEASASPFAAENFSATLTMTSNYMFRGLSFTNDQPALQGSFDWGYGNVFAGVWGSSISDIDDSGYELETDWYAGYADSVAGIDWFVMPIYYSFTDNNLSPDANMWEIWLDASYAINDTFTMHGMYAYSPEMSYEYGDGNYIRGDVTANLPQGFSLTAGVGYQDVEGTGDTGTAFDYTHWDITLAKSVAGFDLSLMYSDTNADKATDSLIVAGWVAADNADDTVTFTVSRSF
jgi:uncharacterized protein (TIGR02001 family)